jgi:hypothetical protein
MDIAEYKEHLQGQIEGTAHWRTRKSEEHPGDLRNLRSAESLAKLAKRMRRLSTRNRVLVILHRLDETAGNLLVDHDDDSRAMEFLEILSEALRRYGFDAPEDGNPQWFLRDLVQSYRRAIEEHEQDEQKDEAERIAALPILFVEGVTDATILTAAWHALFPESELPVNIRASNGTKEMRSLAASGGALRELLPDKPILVLADNDHGGRQLVNDGHLHKGGTWRQLSNGIHWCLLKPPPEFVSTMEKLHIPKDCWPCTIEMCFPAEVRRRAEADGAYGFSGDLLHDLYLQPEVAKRVVAATRKRRKADDGYFYVMAPRATKKQKFANWIAGKGALAASDFAVFEPLFAGMQKILVEGASAEEPLARM